MKDKCLTCVTVQPASRRIVDLTLENKELKSLTADNPLLARHKLYLENKDYLLNKIDELEAINESHRKLNGELREEIAKLKEKMPTKEEAKTVLRFKDKCPCSKRSEDGCDKCLEIRESYYSKLQKIAGEK